MKVCSLHSARLEPGKFSVHKEGYIITMRHDKVLHRRNNHHRNSFHRRYFPTAKILHQHRHTSSAPRYFFTDQDTSSALDYYPSPDILSITRSASSNAVVSITVHVARQSICRPPNPSVSESCLHQCQSFVYIDCYIVRCIPLPGPSLDIKLGAFPSFSLFDSL